MVPLFSKGGTAIISPDSLLYVTLSHISKPYQPFATKIASILHNYGIITTCN